MCILSVYALLKVVGYYDLSVLSMSVMGFPEKSLVCELYPHFFWILELLLTLQSPQDMTETRSVQLTGMTLCM